MKSDRSATAGCRCLVTDTLWTIVLIVWALVKSAFHNVLALFWFMPGRYKDISDNIILITGGGKGLGRLLAVELAKHKPRRIILWGRHTDTLSATASVVTMMGVACDYMVCDVSIREQVEEKAEILINKYGGVTMLINNAGIVYGNTVLKSKPSEIQQTLQTNTLANFWTTKAILPHMHENNSGHIVFINSMLGLMGLNGAADYSCSKHANVGFAESLRLELSAESKDGIHITNVYPYHIDNEMFAGCTTRFPMLFPSLDPQYVAWKVVDSVLTNTDHVLIPRTMYLANILSKVLPSDAVIALHKFTGVTQTMDGFHKRKPKES